MDHTIGTRDALGAPPLRGESADTDAALRAIKAVWRYPGPDLMAFLFFIAFVVARYVQVGARREILATIRLEFLLGIVAAIVATTKLASHKPALGRSRPVLVLILLLFVTMLVQLPFAADPIAARSIFMDRVMKFAILTFLMVVMVESPKHLKWFLVAFLMSIFYITMESVRGLITGGLVWENQGTMRLHGAVPIYMHPNSLSGVALGTLPFCIFLFAHFARWWQKLWLVAVAASSLVCVVYSGSRTAYLGLIGLIFWWWMQSKRKGRFTAWALAIGAVALMMVPKQYIERFESITGEEKDSQSKATRIVILQDAWQVFLDNPLGIGIASFPAVRLREFGRTQDTHNLYLEVGTNLGIQGLVVFAMLIWAMMAAFRRVGDSFATQQRALRAPRLRLRTGPRLRRLVVQHDRNLAFLTAVARAAGGFIFIRLILGMFGMDLYEVYWWFSAGLAIILSGLEPRTRQISGSLLKALSLDHEE